MIYVAREYHDIFESVYLNDKMCALLGAKLIHKWERYNFEKEGKFFSLDIHIYPSTALTIDRSQLEPGCITPLSSPTNIFIVLQRFFSLNAA